MHKTGTADRGRKSILLKMISDRSIQRADVGSQGNPNANYNRGALFFHALVFECSTRHGTFKISAAFFVQHKHAQRISPPGIFSAAQFYLYLQILQLMVVLSSSVVCIYLISHDAGVAGWAL
jgi:hypothetical protein